ncbi:hypothetical protein SNE40_009947 [Patella caerulea]|uniref:Uncharacterized protein n=1 Tax=Patella caerulea TaxID=87958 RepID=A0AAN8PZA0_PATCE
MKFGVTPFENSPTESKKDREIEDRDIGDTGIINTGESESKYEETEDMKTAEEIKTETEDIKTVEDTAEDTTSEKDRQTEDKTTEENIIDDEKLAEENLKTEDKITEEDIKTVEEVNATEDFKTAEDIKTEDLKTQTDEDVEIATCPEDFENGLEPGYFKREGRAFCLKHGKLFEIHKKSVQNQTNRKFVLLGVIPGGCKSTKNQKKINPYVLMDLYRNGTSPPESISPYLLVRPEVKIKIHPDTVLTNKFGPHPKVKNVLAPENTEVKNRETGNTDAKYREKH